MVYHGAYIVLDVCKIHIHECWKVFILVVYHSSISENDSEASYWDKQPGSLYYHCSVIYLCMLAFCEFLFYNVRYLSVC